MSYFKFIYRVIVLFGIVFYSVATTSAQHFRGQGIRGKLYRSMF